MITIGCVVAPCAVVVQRGRTNRRVLGSGRIAKKCDSTDRRIVVGNGVLRERGNTDGCIAAAGSIFSKRTSTRGRVRVAGDVVKEGSVANGRVEAGNNNIHIGNGGANADTETIRIGLQGTQTQTFIAGIRGATTGIANAVNVLIDSNGQLGTMNSSRRFKHKIRAMESASESILALSPVTFRYKSDKTDTSQFGLIAEEVAEVNPDLVVRDEKGEIFTVRYDAVNAMLLNEFLKEHARVEEQDCKIQKQEETITQLKKDLDILVVELKEQDEKIQRVTAQMQTRNSVSQMAVND